MNEKEIPHDMDDDIPEGVHFIDNIKSQLHREPFLRESQPAAIHFSSSSGQDLPHMLSGVIFHAGLIVIVPSWLAVTDVQFAHSCGDRAGDAGFHRAVAPTDPRQRRIAHDAFLSFVLRGNILTIEVQQIRMPRERDELVVGCFRMFMVGYEDEGSVVVIQSKAGTAAGMAQGHGADVGVADMEGSVLGKDMEVAQGLEEIVIGRKVTVTQRHVRTEKRGQAVQNGFAAMQSKAVARIIQAVREGEGTPVVEVSVGQQQMSRALAGEARFVPASFQKAPQLTQATARIQNDQGIGCLDFHAGGVAAVGRAQGKGQMVPDETVDLLGCLWSWLKPDQMVMVEKMEDGLGNLRGNLFGT
jgi:hypothetical protein